MPIQWHQVGDSMGTIDLREIDSDQIVIHYGGRLTSVDAYTFANSLTSLADVIVAINKSLNPGLNIEVRVEALGPGSFRAVIKSLQKGLTGLLKRQGENTVIALLLALIFQYTSKEEIKIIVNADSYVLERGNDRIILPKATYEQLPNVRNVTAVREGIRKTFEVLENDSAIDNFGFTKSLTDKEPLIQIPKSDFPTSATQAYEILDPANQRVKADRVRLIVNRLWLRDVDKKWSFEWNGTPISASIKDLAFKARMKERRVNLQSGDALDVELHFLQNLDEKLGVFVNDHLTYSVERVFGKIDQDTGEEELF